MITVPFVVFGVFRYILLVHRQDAGEEPDQVLLVDRPIQAVLGLWIVTCAIVLLLT